MEDITRKEDFWQQPNNQEILKRKKEIAIVLKEYNSINNDFTYYKEFYEIATNEEAVEIYNNILLLNKNLKNLKLKTVFIEETDKLNCFLEINTGVGGDDACEFSNMLLNMYLKWVKSNNYKVEILNIQDGTVAGITNAIIKITGENIFGILKNESGIHRLVRISPFNANGKRQTSFSSVWVYPEIDDKINIEILDKDLKIDTFRASGAGGQHVNKTDSAIRITHLPTKIVVQSQAQRSQHQNKDTAMKLLKSRLFELEMRKKQEKKDAVENQKTDNGWGHQIRSYVFHPYQMVKDLRSNYETSNINAMMAGELLNDFIESNLFNN